MYNKDTAFERVRFSPLFCFPFRLWRRDLASPKSSTWKQTVSANIFCAGSSHLCVAQSQLQLLRRSSLVRAHFLELNACWAPTQTRWHHLDEYGTRLDRHFVKVNVWNRKADLMNIYFTLVRPLQWPVQTFQTQQLPESFLACHNSGLSHCTESNPFSWDTWGLHFYCLDLHNDWYRVPLTPTGRLHNQHTHFPQMYIKQRFLEGVLTWRFQGLPGALCLCDWARSIKIAQSILHCCALKLHKRQLCEYLLLPPRI